MTDLYRRDENKRFKDAHDYASESTNGSLGAVSFSGADIKAVVYMPIDSKAAFLERDELDEQRNKLKVAIKEAVDWTHSLQVKIANTSEDIARMRHEQGLYLAGSAGWRAYEDQINREVVRLNTTRSQLRRTYSIFPPDAIQNMKDQLKAIQAAVEQLDEFSEGEVGVKPIVLGDLQTITYSSHREKFPVRTLGRVYPKSYTRGPRTLAGSMIFTVINKHALWDLIQLDTRFRNTGVTGSEDHWGSYSTSTVDQIPPFDITLLFSNEYGDNSYMVLYGVEIVNEGQTMSIQDLLTENVMQFVCRDMDPLRPINAKRRILSPGEPFITADDMLRQYDDNSATRRNKRFNPFI